MSLTKVPLLSVDVSAIAHATEDINRVEQSIRFVAECLSKTEVNFTRRYMRGYHGNMIATVSARLSSRQVSNETLRLLSSKLSDEDRHFLSRDLRTCIDEEGNLYLRFDKQDAYLGSMTLHQGDPIRMKLKFLSKHKPEAIAAVCRESGLIL
jgi:RNA binding exosome subunit